MVPWRVCSTATVDGSEYCEYPSIDWNAAYRRVASQKVSQQISVSASLTNRHPNRNSGIKGYIQML